MSKLTNHIAVLERNSRVAFLVHGFIKRTQTGEEAEELDQWILEREDNMQLFEDLTDDSVVEDFLGWYTDREKILSKKNWGMDEPLRAPAAAIGIGRYAAAAAVLCLLATGAYFLFSNINNSGSKETTGKYPGNWSANLILPGRIRVALTEAKDTLINEQIRVSRGELIYKGGTRNREEHELHVAAKATFKVQLPDGSQVWLNAGSSLKYPSVFAEQTRAVRLTGEAYVVVAKDTTRPFVVTSGQTVVTATGTAFAVSCYENKIFTTTLVEGVIRVNNATGSAMLVPGQQLRIQNDQWHIRTLKDPGTSFAWKENEFFFQDNTIQEVMAQVGRWYGVEVIYQDTPTAHFNGRINRNTSLPGLLKMLKTAGDADFLLRNDTLVVHR